MRKALRVHLIAKGDDPDRNEFQVKMSVPSAILELAKLEVMSATADLAERMRETVSTKWVLTSLYKFTEQEAVKLMKERDQESKARAKVEADAQKILAQATAGTEGEAGPEFASSSSPSSGSLLEQRLKKLLDTHQRDVERSFDRKMRSPGRVEEKLDRLLKSDMGFSKRMRNLEGLVSDIRQGL
jgi:hypothetical protein